MALLQKFSANQTQAQVRSIINSNADVAAIKPEEKTSSSTLGAMVGVTTKGEQQLRFASDGQDYLSPLTGISKSLPDQTISGKLKVNSLEVGPNGAIIYKSLKVNNTNKDGTTIFEILSDGTTRVLGSLEVTGILNALNNVNISGSLNARGNNNVLGNTNVTNLVVADTFTGLVLNSTTSSLGTATAASLHVTGTTTLSGAMSVSGHTTFNNDVTISNPGSPTVAFVRPLFIGTGPVPASLPVGVLYGQY